MFSDFILNWINDALDIGITEEEFWHMSIAEYERRIESYNRSKKREAKEKALNDYILADLIGKSISRIFSKNATYPQLNEVYPTLFEVEEVQESKKERLTQLSVLRFKQFANSYTQRRCKETK